jgi:hypothetical protein
MDFVGTFQVDGPNGSKHIDIGWVGPPFNPIPVRIGTGLKPYWERNLEGNDIIVTSFSVARLSASGSVEGVYRPGKSAPPGFSFTMVGILISTSVHRLYFEKKPLS